MSKLPQARSSIEWELGWNSPTPGVYVAEERASHKGTSLSRVVKTRQFAIIRNAYEADGYYCGDGYVVSRNSFDDIRSFTTFTEAKLYVESLYALEKS